jgi:nucleotide-binding universal stress UspA family protein
MPKSILASLTGLGSDRAVMEAAIGAAKIDGGHLTCLHARIDVVETATMVEVTFPQHHDGQEALRRISLEEAERGRHARVAFDDAIKRHNILQAKEPSPDAPITICWKETRSFFNETVEEARYHDLTIMARDPELSSERIKTVLMQSGRPLLLAPPKPLPTIGRKVAIAWKAGAEAARAVTAASSWLAGAQKVLVLSASRNEAGDDSDRLSAERLGRSLAWRGIKAEVEMVYPGSGSEAHALQNRAYDADIDLLVMGAYGHSRLREYVLGGVTEDMLGGCAIPVLMFR